MGNNQKIGNNTTATEAREKIRTDLESLEYLIIYFIKFKTNQILLKKIGQQNYNYEMLYQAKTGACIIKHFTAVITFVVS